LHSNFLSALADNLRVAVRLYRSEYADANISLIGEYLDSRDKSPRLFFPDNQQASGTSQNALDKQVLELKDGPDFYLVLRCRSGFFVHLHIADTFTPATHQHLETLFSIYVNQLGLLWHGMMDSLTGLYNRQAYEDKLSTLCRRYRVAQHRRSTDVVVNPSGAFAMIDIDHFKRINDNFGHVYGDEILIAVARLMQHFFRDNDLLFRYGGEEFVVVLLDVSLPAAQTVFERFRAALAKTVFPKVGVVSASIGYCELDFQLPYRDVAQRADQALYYSKQHGRNQVSCYEHLKSADLLGREPQSEQVNVASFA
jgi:diguanylate cyclase (GGDEF)-like protein